MLCMYDGLEILTHWVDLIRPLTMDIVTKDIIGARDLEVTRYIIT